MQINRTRWHDFDAIETPAFTEEMDPYLKGVFDSISGGERVVSHEENTNTQQVQKPEALALLWVPLTWSSFQLHLCYGAGLGVM